MTWFHCFALVVIFSVGRTVDPVCEINLEYYRSRAGYAGEMGTIAEHVPEMPPQELPQTPNHPPPQIRLVNLIDNGGGRGSCASVTRITLWLGY